MKKILPMVAFLVALDLGSHAEEVNTENASTSRAIADNPTTDRFGIGAIFGEPTGISLKYFLTDVMAVDGVVGWAFSDDTDLHFHSDVLWHKHDIFTVSQGEVSLYGGVGGRVRFREHDSDRVGIRFPVGLAYRVETVPVDIFAEIAPVLDVAPSTRGDFTGGIGARYWF